MKKLIYLSLFSILSLINSFSFSIDWLDNKISATNPETGETYILGKHNPYGVSDWIQLKKLKKDGTIDLTFIKTFPTSSNLNFDTAKITVEKGGKILIEVESIPSKEGYDSIKIKLNSDGSLDTTFGDNGVIINTIELKPAAPPA